MFNVLMPLLAQYMTGEKKKYLWHWLCLLLAVCILAATSIATEELAYARVLLKLFLHQVPSLYGPEFSNLKIHLLTHLHSQDILIYSHMLMLILLQSETF